MALYVRATMVSLYEPPRCQANLNASVTCRTVSQSPRSPNPTNVTGIIPYEQRLDADSDWALREGSMHFDKANAVHKSLVRLARRLDELEIPYAIAGAMALFFHGYRRFTEDVDILVTRDSLNRIHQELEGFGYVPPFAGSKNLRDAETGVRIDFIVAGGYPGDGKPKPISFPDPSTTFEVIDGIRVVGLAKLIELKLASGTATGRLKDHADVQELIKALGLSQTMADSLDLSVRDIYLKLWSDVQNSPPDPVI
jgi:hypothetical protein